MRSQSAPLAASQARLPVFLFSHGLGGTRGAYSAVCAELASAVRGRSCFCCAPVEFLDKCVAHQICTLRYIGGVIYGGRNNMTLPLQGQKSACNTCHGVL